MSQQATETIPKATCMCGFFWRNSYLEHFEFTGEHPIGLRGMIYLCVKYFIYLV